MSAFCPIHGCEMTGTATALTCPACTESFRMALGPSAELVKLRANLTLATRLLRRAVTELNHHVCYEDAETMEFLNPKREG